MNTPLAIPVQIALLRLQPGDVLVVRMPDEPCTAEAMREVRALIKSALPSEVKCIVLEAGYQLQVVRAEHVRGREDCA